MLILEATKASVSPGEFPLFCQVWKFTFKFCLINVPWYLWRQRHFIPASIVIKENRCQEDTYQRMKQSTHLALLCVILKRCVPRGFVKEEKMFTQVHISRKKEIIGSVRGGWIKMPTIPDWILTGGRRGCLNQLMKVSACIFGFKTDLHSLPFYAHQPDSSWNMFHTLGCV